MRLIFLHSNAGLAFRHNLGYDGEEMEKTPKDHPLTAKEISTLRESLSRMSITALRDAYFAAWTRCKLEHAGPPPKAQFIQELVQAWRELRRVG